MSKRPAFLFYPGDWLRDTALRSVSHAARGLWIDLLCLMHDGQPYGHLAINDRRLPDDRACAMAGLSPGEGAALLAELEAHGVLSRQSDGTIYSRRMVKDARIRAVRAKAGSAGGQASTTPSTRYIYAMARHDGAVKVGISRDPARRVKQLERDGATMTLLAYSPGSYDSETKAHIALMDHRIGGEWFRGSPEVLEWVRLNLTPVESVEKQTSGSTTGLASRPAPKATATATGSGLLEKGVRGTGEGGPPALVPGFGRMQQVVRDAIGLVDSEGALPVLDDALRAARNPTALLASIRDIGPGGMQEAGTWLDVSRAILAVAGRRDGDLTARKLYHETKRQAQARQAGGEETWSAQPRSSTPFGGELVGTNLLRKVEAELAAEQAAARSNGGANGRKH